MPLRRLMVAVWMLAATALPLGLSAPASAESGAHRLPPPPPETLPIDVDEAG